MPLTLTATSILDTTVAQGHSGQGTILNSGLELGTQVHCLLAI